MYGPLGLVPLVLVWIYAAWVLVLLGAEITHALQNLRLLEAEDRRQRDDEPINGLVAAQLLAAVAATHEAGGAGHPKERLVAEFGLTPHNVERIVARLKARGLIAEVRGDINGYMPGTRRHDHPRWTRCWPRFARPTSSWPTATRRRRCAIWCTSWTRRGTRRIAGLTIADLMPPPGGRPREEAVPLTIVPPGDMPGLTAASQGAATTTAAACRRPGQVRLPAAQVVQRPDLSAERIEHRRSGDERGQRRLCPWPRGPIIRKPVLVSGPWQPLQVFIDAWKRASGLVMPGPFHWMRSLNTEPARKLLPSN